MNFLRVNINRLALWTLGLNILVIMQGAFVRATGSGAGCGRHWPTCHGEVVPLGGGIQTIIEYSHRGLSSIVLLLGAWLLLRGIQERKERPGFFWFTVAAAILVISEALLGAATVLFELTGDNVSTARGIMVASHLVNSMLLVAALTGVLVYSRRNSPRWPLQLAREPLLSTVFGFGFLLMLVMMFSGGIAAMGNTMFPAESLADGVAMDFSADSHPLIRLRILHPLIAVTVGIFLFLTLGYVRARKPVAQAQRTVQALFTVYVVQFIVGIVNFAMLAPVTLQIIHLGFAVATFSLYTAVAVLTLGYPLPETAAAGAARLPHLEGAFKNHD